MTIICPHCGFSRDIDQARLPSKTIGVTCPRCKETFPFSGEVGIGRPESPPAPQPGAAAMPPPAEAIPKAGFWIRVVAALVDSVVVTVVQIVLGLALGLAASGLGGDLGQEGQAAVAMVTWLFGTVLAVVYYVFFTGYCGQTPGKMAVRVKVIRTDGSEIGYGRAALREVLGKFISGILLGIGYLMVAFDPQKQGLHDKIADTYVIKL